MHFKLYFFLLFFRSLKMVTWATLSMEKEVQGTGCPMSTVPASPRSRTWLQCSVRGRSFMRAARISAGTRSSWCGTETAMRSSWTSPWAFRSQNRGGRHLGPLKVSSHLCLSQQGSSSRRTRLSCEREPPPAASLLPCGAPPSAEANAGETILGMSLTKGALPSEREMCLPF